MIIEYYRCICIDVLSLQAEILSKFVRHPVAGVQGPFPWEANHSARCCLAALLDPKHLI
jgi:hypothetical protein